MTVFVSTLNQMGYLALLVIIGYIVARIGAVPKTAFGILSKIENYILIPALVLNTFMTNFTVDRLSVSWQPLVAGFAVGFASIALALVFSRLCTKDDYVRKIFTYGLSFSNFGFMGNAVVQAVYPDVFTDYLIFVLPLWILIYMWGVPAWLIPSGEGKVTLGSRLRALLNPMFISTLVGMALGLINLPALIKIPLLAEGTSFFLFPAISTLGSCMSPVAMLLTGMAIAQINIKDAFKNISVYAVSFVRLIVFPMFFILLLLVVDLPETLAICGICALAMPLGLNTIVVPGAYGLDTTAASGMALISHLLSALSIPLVFMLFEKVIA